MSNPTTDERKEWWIRIYAHTSFEKSLTTCEQMLAHVRTTGDDLYLPLAVAMHAFYGRPFKLQRGVGKLSEDYIPAEWKGIHRCIITFRDQMFVHTDANNVEAAGRPLNDVVYHNVGSENLFSTNDPRPRLGYYHDVAEYLPSLIKKVRDEIDTFHDSFSDYIPKTEGHFQLNLTGDMPFSPYQPPDEKLTF